MTPPGTNANETVKQAKVTLRRDVMQRFGRPVLALILIYLLVSTIWTQVTADEATDDKHAAQEQARSLAEQVAEACAKGGQAAAELGPACGEAKDIQETPAPVDPEKGADGRGITGTAIVNGRLQISYTDGTTEDKGVVVGAAGAAGVNGRGVVSASIDPAGRLALTYTDGTGEDVGPVVGPSGGDGQDGSDGRSVVSVTVSPDFHLIVSYDDGTTADAGSLPPGPQGEPGVDGQDGRGITSVAFDFDSCQATISYTDGTSEKAPMTGCENDPDPDPGPPLDPLPGG